MCCRFVINSIRKASGEEVKSISGDSCGVAHAKDAGDALVTKGYTLTENTIEQAQTGDVIIFGAIRGHLSGHIAIKCADAKWRSDFVQKQANGWKDGKGNDPYVIYSK